MYPCLYCRRGRGRFALLSCQQELLCLAGRHIELETQHCSLLITGPNNIASRALWKKYSSDNVKVIDFSEINVIYIILLLFGADNRCSAPSRCAFDN